MNSIVDPLKHVIKIFFAGALLFFIGSQFVVECRYNAINRIRELTPDRIEVKPKAESLKEPEVKAKYYVDGKQVTAREYFEWARNQGNTSKKTGKGNMISEDLKINSQTKMSKNQFEVR